MRSAPDWAALPTSGTKQLSSCPEICAGALDAAGRLAAEGPAPVPPDAAGGLAAGAGVQALAGAAGVLADGALELPLDAVVAAAELCAVSGIQAGSSPAD